MILPFCRSRRRFSGRVTQVRRRCQDAAPSARPGPPGPPSPGTGIFFAPAVNILMDSPSPVNVPNRPACVSPAAVGQGSLSAAGHTDENQILLFAAGGRLPPGKSWEIPMAHRSKTEWQSTGGPASIYSGPGAGMPRIFCLEQQGCQGL